MIRLRSLQAATLLLLLLQIASVEGLLNLTDCDVNKACWVGQECVNGTPISSVPQNFYLKENDEQFNEILKPKDCYKYLIVEPGTDHFIFEIMHDAFMSSDTIILSFRRTNEPTFKSYFTCKDHKAATPDTFFRVDDEPFDPLDHAFCRFKITKRLPHRTDKEFYSIFTGKFKHQSSNGKTLIPVVDYNLEHFKGRVPCISSIFKEEGDKKEHYVKPLHSVKSTLFSCPSNYTMSYMTETVKKMQHIEIDSEIRCELGKVVLYLKEASEAIEVTSAQCARRRNTLCASICNEDCEEKKIKKRVENEQPIFGCKTQFMIYNLINFTRLNARCSDKSSPDNHLWDVKGEFSGKQINEIKCVEELDCNDITPFEHTDCQNCKNVTKAAGGITCDNGERMIIMSTDSNARHNVTVTCSKLTGEWQLEYGGKTHAGTKEEMKKWKLGCSVPNDNKEKDEPPPAAASSAALLYVGIGLGVLLFILLFILLLYYICCRKGRKEPPPREESSKQPTPPKTTTDSSNVEAPLPLSPPPPPSAPEESDPTPGFSGKRVQMINMSKEHLREIEPEPPLTEVSARDKTLSDKSKASQVGQVADVPTVTGRQTEKTNEMSRTVANGDDSRSDVSRGRNSTAAENSQTGAGGNTPTIGDAEKKRKKDGPRVAFRERVSYETDPTKTRDKTSIGSMHTAPEQPAPPVDVTQPEGSTVEGKRKDDPSRLGADSARKAFGKERTRTTQATKETHDQDSTAGNRSKSRVTDISRTG